MKGSIYRIEVRTGIGDEPTTATLTDTSVSQNQWACSVVLRGNARVSFEVNSEGLKEVRFTPHGAS